MTLKEFNLEGKTAIVTGAARGLGRSIALTLAEAGADVVAADISPQVLLSRDLSDSTQKLDQTCDEIRQLGRKSLAVFADVGQTEQVEEMVEAAVAEFGKVDILVNNAGVDLPKPLLLVDGKPPVPMRVPVQLDSGLTEEEWDTMININLNGFRRCAVAVGRHMIERRSGKIIGLGSVVGLRARANAAAYAASKAAVHRFTQALALEWGGFNINVNTIAPGPIVPTDSWWVPRWNVSREENDASIERIPARVPLGRAGDPREIGLLAVFLASDASNFMTGQVIALDGGSSLV
ncbi:MAG: SDR family oxidoreductase [Rhodospirillaceae bacterium]|nr:SDR family oxidoreductase [Rhodospirillaceae bacterium]